MGCHGESWYPKSSNAPQLLQLLFHTTTQVISVSSWGRWGSNHPTSPEVCRCSAPMTTQRFDLETVPTNKSMLLILVNQVLLLSSVPCMKTCEPLRKKFGLGPVPSLSNRSLGPAAFQAVKTCVDALHTLHNLALIAADEESDCHQPKMEHPWNHPFWGSTVDDFRMNIPKRRTQRVVTAFWGFQLGSHPKASPRRTDTVCHEPKTALRQLWHQDTPMNIFISGHMMTYVHSISLSFMVGNHPRISHPPKKKKKTPLQRSMDLVGAFHRCNPKKKGSKWGQKKSDGNPTSIR